MLPTAKRKNYINVPSSLKIQAFPLCFSLQIKTRGKKNSTSAGKKSVTTGKIKTVRSLSWRNNFIDSFVFSITRVYKNCLLHKVLSFSSASY